MRMRPLALALALVLSGVGVAAGQKPAPAKSAVKPAAARPVAKRAARPAATAVVSSRPLPELVPEAPPGSTFEQQEQFLRKARILKTKGNKKGVTGTQRATMSDGVITHDASIQTVDQSVSRFETNRGVELNFRDYWGYNVAAYRLGRMLDLDMIPPSVARRHQAKEAAFTWWVDDVMMDEQGRMEKKTAPPDSMYWRAQNDIIRLFDTLIANVDRNQGNILIDQRWKLWMIDHTRAFRLGDGPKAPDAVARCERKLFEKLKALDVASMKAELDRVLTESEIKAVLRRRDAIVARLEALGPTALYDMVRPAPEGALASK